MMNVLLVGHSFIRRLGYSIDHSADLKTNFGLGINQCVVHFYGVSGGTLQKLKNDRNFIQNINSVRPSVIIVQIGGNDLCSPCIRPEVFTCELIEWFKSLQEQFIFLKNVVICELFIRRKPRFIDAQTYEIRRVIVNRMLKNMLEVQDNMVFWRHLRLMQSPMDILDKDGVHLSALGTKKFYRSLRLALLHAIR